MNVSSDVYLCEPNQISLVLLIRAIRIVCNPNSNPFRVCDDAFGISSWRGNGFKNDFVVQQTRKNDNGHNQWTTSFCHLFIHSSYNLNIPRFKRLLAKGSCRHFDVVFVSLVSHFWIWIGAARSHSRHTLSTVFCGEFTIFFIPQMC